MPLWILYNATIFILLWFVSSFIFVVMGICSTFLRSVSQARAHHHHRYNEKKDTDFIEQNAMQFVDMPELLAELGGEANDDAVRDIHESEIKKRHVNGEVRETHKSEIEKRYSSYKDLEY